MSLLQSLVSLGPWNWLFLAVALFALEAVLPGVHLLWFGVAAILTGFIGLAVGLAWPSQVGIFALLSVAVMFAARRLAGAETARSDIPGLNQRGSEYIGRVVPVEDPIRAGRGKVRVGDSVWIAEGPESPVGSRVRIKGTNGTVLIVERE
jgi:membrane protein implicated in regulation of membrane protease activity